MSDKLPVVYMFRNKETNETYIGSTAHEARRKNDHLRALKNGNHVNYKFQKAYDKNPNFEFVASKPLPDQRTALKHEQQLIDVLQGSPLLLNIAECATASMLNLKHTPEARERMSAASLGKPKTEEHANNIRMSKIGVPRPQSVIDAVIKANTGLVRSDEVRLKMSLAQTGKVRPPRTQEHTDKIREAKAGFTHTPESIAKIRESAPGARKVSINGVVYPSVAEAERNVGLSHRAIRGRIASEKDQNKDWTYI